MNIILGRVSSTLGLAALTMICGGLSAQAETVDTIAADPAVTPLVSQSNESFTAQANPASANTLAEVARSAANESSLTTASESANQVLEPQLALEPSTDMSQEVDSMAVDSTREQQSLAVETPDNAAETASVPETTSQTTSSNLVTESSAQAPAKSAETLAQVLPEVTPGRATASSPSYFGIGGNFGITGDSSLGSQSLTLFSKIGLTRFFSIRPSVFVDFDDDATFLVPVTLDLPGRSLFFIPGIVASPYIGGGLAASTNDGIGGAIIAGLDLPVAPQFTLTTGVNLGFIDDFNLGVQVGIGYNFSGF